MSKQKNWVVFIAVMLVTVFLFTACTSGDASGDKYTVKSRTIINVNEYSSDKLQEYFDDVIYEENRITAYQTFDKNEMLGCVNASLVETEKVRTAYDVEYSDDEDIIYVSISTFDENDTLIDVSVATGYPIRYENGIDVSLEVDGKTVYLSELLGNGIDNCFFVAAAVGLFSAAKIIAALVATAKVAAVITGVVVIGAISYKVVSFSEQKKKEREREAEIEDKKKKDNPRYYYPAQLKSNKLLIAANPHYLRQAVGNVIKGTSYWTPQDYMAKKLAIESSGGYFGPEIDMSGGKPKNGHYYHYHLLKHKAGTHIWFGGAYGGAY